MDVQNLKPLFHKNTQSSDYCPMCKGTGFILAEKSTEKSIATYGDDRKIEYAVPCPNCNGGAAQRTEAVKQRANIPTAFYNVFTADFNWDIYGVDVSNAKERSESFIKDYPKWEESGRSPYIFSKSVGSGKTYLASMMCNEIMKSQQITTKFASVSNLIEISKSGNERERDPIDILCKCKLLVLDDIGAQSANDWLNDLLFRILDERYQKKRTTIFTANAFYGDLESVIGQRNVARIKSMTITVMLPNIDVRAKKADSKDLEFLKSVGCEVARKKGV